MSSIQASRRRLAPSWRLATGGFALAVFAALLATFGLLAAGPSGKISGRVTDQATGAPLVAVAVLLDSTTLGCQTDTSGYFTIPSVPPGSYTLTVRHPGFETVSQSGVIVRADAEVTLHVALVAVPAARDTLTPALSAEPSALDASGATVDEVLSLDVGFVKQGEELHLRGGRSGEVQTIVDGTRVRDPLGGRQGFDGAGGSDAALNVPRKMTRDEFAFQGGVVARHGGLPCVQDPLGHLRYGTPFGTEEYSPLSENKFLDVLGNPLSTFSIDVDAASYGNARRFLQGEQLPPRDAIRIEELINYFDYDYPQPVGEHPFSVTVEQSECPWNTEHRLVHIGLQGRKFAGEEMPASNLVFLLDVSGSMQPENKLPLVRKAFHLLVDQLQASDRVAIVVYAGAAGLVLPSTQGSDKRRIHHAIDRLEAGGTTAGAAGIQLAYQVAQQHFIKGGNNRIILATDGDFNVGTSSTGELVRLIEEKRKAGVFLTILGFGMGNLKDSRLEQLADKGNGHYAYIDNLREAHKVFVTELTGTLFTIAKDVKLQLEFNPARIASYRLIGYENRLLAKEDFANDSIDSGELGAGHTVTALYEVVPANASVPPRSTDSLRYQSQAVQPEALFTDEILTLKLRYKAPDGEVSKLMVVPVRDRHVTLAQASNDFRFSAAVAEFGLLLRDSQHKGQASWAQVRDLAKGSLGSDREGFRAEFVDLVNTAARLSAQQAAR